MVDTEKTKSRRVAELVSLRARIDELESSLSAVRESEAMFRFLLDSLDDRVRAKDIEGRYLYVNPAFAKTEHLTPTDFIGKTTADLYEGEKASLISRADAEALLGESIQLARYDESQPGKRVYDSIISPMRKSNSTVVGTIAVSRDITERQEAENAYRESEERFRQIAESLETGLWLRNPSEEEFLYANQAWRDVWGTRSSAARLELVHPDDRAEQEHRTQERVEGREVEPDTLFRIARTEGEMRWLRSRTIPIRDPKGVIYRYAGIVIDITEQVSAEETAKNLRRRLLTVQEDERRAMARELHDEVGQDLTGLSLLLKARKRGAGMEDGRDSADGLELVESIMTKVRDLSLVMRPSMLDDLGLLPAILWLTRRMHAQTQLDVKVQHHGLVERLPAEVETAAYRVSQEALNNVARHAETAKAELSLQASDRSLEISIEDQGVGFDPVEKLDSSVGLLGMRERVELLGGKFDVVSSPGHGTRITAQLDLNEVAEHS